MASPTSAERYAPSSWNEDSTSSASQKRFVLWIRSPDWVCGLSGRVLGQVRSVVGKREREREREGECRDKTTRQRREAKARVKFEV